MGSRTSTLIQEIVLAMRVGLTTEQILDQIYIHPALTEVVQRAVNSIEW